MHVLFELLGGNQINGNHTEAFKQPAHAPPLKTLPSAHNSLNKSGITVEMT